MYLRITASTQLNATRAEGVPCRHNVPSPRRPHQPYFESGKDQLRIGSLLLRCKCSRSSEIFQRIDLHYYPILQIVRASALLSVLRSDEKCMLLGAYFTTFAYLIIAGVMQAATSPYVDSHVFRVFSFRDSCFDVWCVQVRVNRSYISNSTLIVCPSNE